MTLFADTREFKAALRDAILHASQPAPSRRALAAQLEVLAGKLGAKPRKKAPAKAAPPPRVMHSIGAEEEKVLGWLEGGLDSALGDVKREKSYAADAVEFAEEGKNPWDPGNSLLAKSPSISMRT